MTRTPQGAVEVDPRARSAWPVLRGIAFAVPGTIFVGGFGEVLRVLANGSIDEVLPGGHPRRGAASDPCNARRAAAPSSEEEQGA